MFFWGRFLLGSHLLEFLDVDVQLRPQLGLGLREGRDLGMEGFRTVRFLLGVFALLLVAGEIPLDFEFLCAEQGVEV